MFSFHLHSSCTRDKHVQMLQILKNLLQVDSIIWKAESSVPFDGNTKHLGVKQKTLKQNSLDGFTIICRIKNDNSKSQSRKKFLLSLRGTIYHSENFSLSQVFSWNQSLTYWAYPLRKWCVSKGYPNFPTGIFQQFQKYFQLWCLFLILYSLLCVTPYSIIFFII